MTARASAPVDDLEVEAVDLSADQQRWVEEAWSQIDEERLRALVVDMTGIPSPTGEERLLAEYLTATMQGGGLEAWYQPIDERQGNAVGRLTGTGDGPDLLLYAPIDTLTVGTEEEDCPMVAPALRPDMRPEAVITDHWVMGLGASNPKGHGACIVAAAEAVRRAGIPLRGSVLVGLGAGGMPTNKRSAPDMNRYNAGQGNGCSFMLEQGVQADFAILAKPGWSVAWEEVGLCWFTVRVRGAYGYVGSRHRIPYRNPVVEVGKVVAGLERWFPQYTARNTSGLVAPQGHIGAIRGGWARTPSLSASVCELSVDLRISPRTTPMEAKRQFGEALRAIEDEHPDLELDWDMVLAISGTSTDPGSWIVQSCARAWEVVEGRPHEVLGGTSGATDANILRHRGIPTARVGMPKPIDDQGIEVDFAMGMNAVDVRHMTQLTRLLVHSIVETCTTSRIDVGIRS